eukprot:GHUV01006924.1.p1 GENE.GHUV01006924.1~~GHUV01006924.1.p1  ORF type:complete len:181 (+),score=40.32 GHUV01006924.1:280-822(+)
MFPPSLVEGRLVSLRELGGLASWSVTSAKPGNGVELLRDGSQETYWQSDGTQPHLVNIQFNRRMELKELHVYLDYKLDESYTPSRLAVRAGSAYHDLKDICVVELREPTGWMIIPLAEGQPGGCLKAFFVQVAILANHQNGRDTHVRQILLYGPGPGASSALSSVGQFNTPEFNMFSMLR